MFVDGHPHLDLNIHIDDLAITANELNDDNVVEKIGEGAAALHTLVENELECKVSVPKADHVANSNQLRARVGKVLGAFWRHMEASCGNQPWY